MTKVIYNDVIPFKGYKAITIWPFIFARNSVKPLSEVDKNHEQIHLKQQQEVLVTALAIMLILCIACISWWWMCAVPFVYYLWYCIEYLVRSLMYGNGKEGYRNISFEQEAYLNEKDYSYPYERKPFAWVKYLGKKTYWKKY